MPWLYTRYSFLCSYCLRVATIPGWRLFPWKTSDMQRRLDKVHTSVTVTTVRHCQSWPAGFVPWRKNSFIHINWIPTSMHLYGHFKLTYVAVVFSNHTKSISPSEITIEAISLYTPTGWLFLFVWWLNISTSLVGCCIILRWPWASGWLKAIYV